MELIAHSGSDSRPEGHPLGEHLREVACLAEGCFPEEEAFLRQMARAAGMAHDAGKCAEQVQRHIRQGTDEHPDHSTLGGVLLYGQNKSQINMLLASVAMGHHGGMPDCVASGVDGAGVEIRLKKALPPEARARFEQNFGAELAAVSAQANLPQEQALQPFGIYMLARMTYSALVDADFLNTEKHFSPEQAAARGGGPALGSLLEKYERYMTELRAGVSDLADVREQIRRECICAAAAPQGIFTLSVPTGGGKTLSSCAFGLYHARAHPNIRRIIYAIPFTSIIEQNADVLRNVFGPEAVLEHHSAVAGDGQGGRLDRAAENWDAPVIVTTNVQLFESIFSNKPSRSRRLHNMQDSVIILDEMQALPDAQLRPCLAALRVLAACYRVTVVICTATQPDYSSVWPQDGKGYRPQEMIADPERLFARMTRTRTELLGTLSMDSLAERLAGHRQALCVVNTRAAARALAGRMGGEECGCYHLSGMMCPEHRTGKLKLIRKLLEDKQRCIVVSTSLIEAGVDVDFPVVYRQEAGLDSIAQAAGRCNRNGRQPLPAPVYVFALEGEYVPPETQRLASIGLREYDPTMGDLLGRENMARYFAQRFGSAAELDSRDILNSLKNNWRYCTFPYASIGADFHLIQSAGEPLFIPYDQNARALIDRLENDPSPGALLRKLQRYSVNIYPNQRRLLESSGVVRSVGGALVLSAAGEQLAALYTDQTGLDPLARTDGLFDA